MDFFLAVIMLFFAILVGIFWTEMVNWIYKKYKHTKKQPPSK